MSQAACVVFLLCEIRHSFSKWHYSFNLSLNYKYLNFGKDDIYETAKHNDEIENVPSIAKVVLRHVNKNCMENYKELYKIS